MDHFSGVSFRWNHQSTQISDCSFIRSRPDVIQSVGDANELNDSSNFQINRLVGPRPRMSVSLR